MKKIIVTFILFFTFSFIYSQELQVTYENNLSKYFTYTEYLFIKNNKILGLKDTINISKNKIDSKSNIPIFVIKEKNNQIIYSKSKNKVVFNGNLGDEQFQIQDDIPALNWETNYDDTKVILGYICNKATITFRGSKLTAYYTKKIKYEEGPYKFWGLPGLILEIKDDENSEYNNWIATKIDFNLDESHKNLDFENVFKDLPKISYKEYLMLLEKKRDEDFYNRVIKTAAPGIKIEKRKIKRGGIEKKYEWED